MGTVSDSLDDLFIEAFSRLDACPGWHENTTGFPEEDLPSKEGVFCWSCKGRPGHIKNDLGLCRECAITMIPGLEHLESLDPDRRWARAMAG